MWDEDARASRSIHDAVEREIAVCMKGRGFEYKPTTFTPDTPRPPQFGDVESAKKYGFKRQGGADPSADQPVGKAFMDALYGLDGPDQNMVTIQLAGGGQARYNKNACLAIGSSKVVGDYQAWMESKFLIQELSNSLLKKVETDPRWVASEQKWSQCMADSGYGSNERLQQREASLAKGPVADKREIDAAVAQATCDNKVGVKDLRAELTLHYEKSIMAENQGAIIRWSELRVVAQKSAERRDR